MREHQDLKIWASEEAQIKSFELEKYTRALLTDNEKEKRIRQRSTRSGGKSKKKDSENKLLVVYPFGVDEATLDEAASGLTELGGDLLGVEGAEHSASQLVDEDTNDPSDGGDDNDGKTGKLTRTHYITIREDDVERLAPGQFLNDSLVDFWMRW